MGFGSAAGLTSAFGARAGEESGAGSGQPWEEHATGSSGPRRTSPRGSRVARASSPFSRKKPTPQASVRNFLTKTCWPLVQKLQNTTVKVEQTRGRAVAFPANSYTPVKAPRAETAPAAGPSATLRSRSSVSSPRCAVAPRRSLSVCIVPLPRPVRFGSFVQRPAGAESMHSAC